MRDALAALGNVEAVLRSKAQLGSVELEELKRGLAWLRDAFNSAAAEASEDQREARSALASFADARLLAIESALETPEKEASATLARASADLDAAAGLLELAERATEGIPVEVSVATLAEQSLRVAWTIRAQGAIGVHVRASTGDCSVSCDPHVMARLLAIAVSMVRESSRAVTVRTHVEEDAGVIEVTGFTSDDLDASVMQTHLVPRVEPTETVVRAAARAAGIDLVIEGAPATRVLLRCPRVV